MKDVLILMLCFYGVLVGTVAGAATAEQAITTAADTAVSSIDATFPLFNSEIQLAPGEFRELETGRLSGFSESFGAALSASLSRAGARVSLHEQGEEPLTLVGSYTITAGTLTATVRLRRFGKTESSDLAVVRTEIELDDIPPGLLEDSLAAGVESLVSMLERETILINDVDSVINTPLPWPDGVPTRRFADQYAALLSDALMKSPLFGGVSFGVKQMPHRIVPRYEFGPESVMLRLELRDRDGTALFESGTSVSRALVPETAVELWDSRKLSVCTVVIAGGKRDVKPGSSRAAEMTGALAEVLNERFGVALQECSEGVQSDRVLYLKLKVGRKTTPDGYQVLTGDFRVEIRDQDNRIIGTVNRQVSSAGSVGSRSITPLMRNLLDTKIQDDLGTILLSCRKSDAANMR